MRGARLTYADATRQNVITNSSVPWRTRKNNLYLMAALGVIVAVYVAVNWTSMPVLQRMVSLFFVGLVMHLWEVGAQPGGRACLLLAPLQPAIGSSVPASQ